jgi:hypothetical protein
LILNRCRHLAWVALLCACPWASADFAYAVTPPRFELAAKPGEAQRQVIEITNASPSESGTLLVRTADWRFEPDGSSAFIDELQPGSCRPWAVIERRELVVAPRQAYRFRFEVTPPPGQAPVECRFAIMFQGKEASQTSAGGPSVTGRVAVIVYVAVGDVAPALSLAGGRVRMNGGQPMPALDIVNSGTAHGRVDGFLTVTDARGRSFEAAPASTPILPGETRAVALNLNVPADAGAAARPEFPLTVQGKLEWGKGRSTEVNLRIAR